MNGYTITVVAVGYLVVNDLIKSIHNSLSEDIIITLPLSL